MGGFTQHITSEGERWDNVAQAAYGDSSNTEDIIKANPRVAIDVVFKAGVRLLIPIVEVKKDGTDVNSLPPWKRGTENVKVITEIVSTGVFEPVKIGLGSFDNSFDESHD